MAEKVSAVLHLLKEDPAEPHSRNAGQGCLGNSSYLNAFFPIANLLPRYDFSTSSISILYHYLPLPSLPPNPSKCATNPSQPSSSPQQSSQPQPQTHPPTPQSR